MATIKRNTARKPASLKAVPAAGTMDDPEREWQRRSSPEFMRVYEAKQEPSFAWLSDVVLPAVRRARGAVDLLTNGDGPATFPGSFKAAAQLALHELIAVEEALRRFDEWDGRTTHAEVPHD
jgi:hypothetical protein